MAVMMILMYLIWRRAIDSDELRDSSIFGSSMYPMLYFPLAFIPLVLLTWYLCNTF